MTFGQVLPTLVKICEETPSFDSVERCCVVRDLQGRVRLVLKGGKDLDVERLNQTLAQSLGKYYVPSIRHTEAEGDEGRLAKKVLEVSLPWDPGRVDLPETVSGGEGGRWRKIERRFSKQVWLEEGAPQPPWSLKDGPPIVTFYSFKGGVGRTTALVSCAWQLARQKKKVAIIDLDLEAPGLGSLLECGLGQGALDFIVDYLATGSREASSLIAPAHALGTSDASQVDVISAGALDLDYVEKLSRLDFLGFQGFSQGEGVVAPIEDALAALLHAVRAERRPDFIFIDSRAGLHDLAGLSLHGLAHVDVVVSRASKQAYAGLDLTIRALGLRKKEEDFLGVIVHGFAPSDLTSEPAKEELREFRQKSHDAFRKYVYSGDVPDVAATDVAHSPWIIKQDSALERFHSLVGIQERLFANGYSALLDRILELCLVDGEEQ